MEPASLLGAIPNIFYLVDENYKITYASKHTIFLSGQKAENIKGGLCYEVIMSQKIPCSTCPLKRDKPEEIEIIHDIIASNGERLFYIATFARTESGLIESLTNITKLRREVNQHRYKVKELKAAQVAEQFKNAEIINQHNFIMDVFDDLSSGILVANSDYSILMINEVLSRDSGAKVGSKCYSVYGYTEACPECPFKKPGIKKSFHTMDSRYITIYFELNGDYIVENIRDTTREVELIKDIRASQEENEEKQRQMSLLNRDLLRMNDKLKAAQKVIDEELAQVGMIQQSLLPEKLPEIVGYEFGAFYTPAEHAGGDYYDCISMSNDHWGLAIADVSGHGTPAAVIMAMVRAMMRSYTYDVISSAEALGMVNEILCENIYTKDFVTMFYAVFNPADGQLNYSSAGHNPVLHYDASCMLVRPLTAEGLFIGVFPKVNFHEKSICLKKGDIIFMYTDGLVEAMNENREQYGVDRLTTRLMMYHDRPCNIIIDEIMNDVKSFTSGLPFDDDVTILVLKRNEEYDEKSI